MNNKMLADIEIVDKSNKYTNVIIYLFSTSDSSSAAIF
jgi:hypothetical protein